MLQVGDIVRLKVDCLGNPAGTIGFVYDVYVIGDRTGSSVIFVNGEYDGFSPYEIACFLEYVSGSSLNYYFTNVIKLYQDFQNGYFKSVLGG